MEVVPTEIADVLIFEPQVYEDERGFFLESFNQKQFERLTRIAPQFVQDNHSRSIKNVLRGLHYQIKNTQGKLIRVVYGEVFDVAVDIRKSSPTFGRWIGVWLTSENKRILWIPEGFAHGFLVRSNYADTLYKTTDYYEPRYERSILWNDPSLDINWPLQGEPKLSAKDREAVNFQDAETFA